MTACQLWYRPNANRNLLMHILQILFLLVASGFYVLYVLEAFRESRGEGLLTLLVPPFCMYFAYARSSQSPYNARGMLAAFAVSLTIGSAELVI